MRDFLYKANHYVANPVEFPSNLPHSNLQSHQYLHTQLSYQSIP